MYRFTLTIFILLVLFISIPQYRMSVYATSIPGDLNGDGNVNIYDYNQLVADFGHPYTIFDYNSLVEHFGMSGVTPTPQASNLIFSLTDHDSNFNILPAFGASAECATGTQNLSKGWEIPQWNNDQSLCLSTAQSDPNNCPDAAIVRETGTSRMCYWQNQKKIQLALNSNAMKDYGCAISSQPNAASNPGGYSLYLDWDASNDGALWASGYPAFTDLDHIYISTKQTNNYFTTSSCPASIPADRNSGKNPYGFTYLSVIAEEIDPTTKAGSNLFFYQIVTYDNRYDAAASTTTPNNLDCGAEGYIVIGENIGYYGKPAATPNGATQDYAIDVLPRMKQFIAQCRSGQTIHWDRYKVTGMYMGSEIANTTVITSTFENPMLTLVRKGQ